MPLNTIWEESSLDSSENIDIGLYGAQINTPVHNTKPFMVSNHKLGGHPIDMNLSWNDTLPDRHPWHTPVPAELLAGLYQLHNFLRNGGNVASYPLTEVEQNKERALEARIKLKRHQNNLTLVTGRFEDFNTKIARLANTADVTRHIHNHMLDVNACAGVGDRHKEYLAKLGEEVKAEYLLFFKYSLTTQEASQANHVVLIQISMENSRNLLVERPFNLTNGSVQDNLFKTFKNIQNSLVALDGRLETVRILVEQLKTKHEILMDRRKSWWM